MVTSSKAKVSDLEKISKIKKGHVFYRVLSGVDDELKCYCEVNEVIVTSIRKKSRSFIDKMYDKQFDHIPQETYYIHLCVKNNLTFDYKTNKWLPSPDSFYRKKYPIGGALPHGVFTTKLQALKNALKYQEEYVSTYDGEKDSEYESEKRLISVIKGKLTKIRNEKAKKTSKGK